MNQNKIQVDLKNEREAESLAGLLSSSYKDSAHGAQKSVGRFYVVRVL